ncbi:MAG: hypothetical protein PHS17_10800 [Desulfobacterales bacterium]|nr:hypothetical protein [Desulfobacterales bacterium]
MKVKIGVPRDRSTGVSGHRADLHRGGVAEAGSAAVRKTRR